MKDKLVIYKYLFIVNNVLRLFNELINFKNKLCKGFQQIRDVDHMRERISTVLQDSSKAKVEETISK